MVGVEVLAVVEVVRVRLVVVVVGVTVCSNSSCIIVLLCTGNSIASFVDRSI